MREDRKSRDGARGDRLRVRAAAQATRDIADDIQEFMLTTYCAVLGTPERMKAFLLPLMFLSDEARSKVHVATIQRRNVVESCEREMQRRIKLALWGDPDSFGRSEFAYQQNQDFDQVMAKELDRCGEREFRRILEGALDLAACFKVNCQAPARENYKTTYSWLCEACPALKRETATADDWSRLCKEAVNVRNRFIGHSTPKQQRELAEEALRPLAPLREAVRLLHSPEINRREYQKVMDDFARWEKQLRWEVVPFEALGDTGLSCREISCSLTEHGILCGADCALYESGKALMGRLAQIRSSYRWIPLDSVRDAVKDELTAEECEEALRRCGVTVNGGEAFFSSGEKLFGILERELDARKQARQAALYKEEAEKLREELQLKDVRLGELLRDAEFRRKVEKRLTAGLLGRLPRLEEDYQKGELSQAQLLELARTHQLVLDPSVLRAPQGRDFINAELIPCIRALRESGRDVHMLVDATARYHLYQDCEAHKAARRACLEGRRERTAPEQRSRELESAEAAYFCMEDSLHKQGLLRYVGIPRPACGDGESLRTFLEQNPTLRVCVFTAGVSRLPELVRHQEFPLCVVARVSGGLSGKTRCRIFPEYLPLVRGGGENADLMTEAVRRSYRISGEGYLLEEAGADDEEDAGSGPEAPDDEAELQATPPVPPRPAAGAKRGGRQPAFPPVSELRQVRDERLPCGRPAEPGDVLWTETGTPVRLTERLRENGQDAEGGEGILYCVDTPGQAAKIYRVDPQNYKLTSGRREKLEDMIAHDPGIDGLCWPTHMLYNREREFVGYLMPLAPRGALAFQRSVMQLTKETVRNLLLPGWDRLDLARTAQAVAGMAAKLHRNNILMGDVNDGNFMVDPRESGRVYLVDCDSYQFDGYACPVGTMDYTHPNTAARLHVSGDLRFGEFLRLEEEEDYTLGILLFRILMLGQYPFATRSGMTPAQAMRERNFPFTVEEVSDIPVGDSWMIWKNMPQRLAKAFLDTFREWAPPKAWEWEQLLKSYVYSIENFGFSRELTPVKYHEFHPEAPFYIDVTCEIDGVEFNMPRKQYDRIRRQKQHVLCRSCKDALKQFEGRAERLTCHNCGRAFTGTARQGYLWEKLGEKCYCRDCADVPQVCVACGAAFTVPRGEFEKNASRRFCGDCEKVEEHVCEVCGNPYKAKHGSYRLTKEKYKSAAMCQACRSAETLRPTCCACGREFELKNTRDLLRRRYADGRGFFCDLHGRR